MSTREEFERQLAEILEKELGPRLFHDPGETGIGTLPTPSEMAGMIAGIFDSKYRLDILLQKLEGSMSDKAGVFHKALSTELTKLIMKWVGSDSADIEIKHFIEEASKRLTVPELFKSITSAPEVVARRLVDHMKRSLRQVDDETWSVEMEVSTSAGSNLIDAMSFLAFLAAFGASVGSHRVQLKRMESGSFKAWFVALFRGASRAEVEATLEELGPKAINALAGKLEGYSATADSANADAGLARVQAESTKVDTMLKLDAAETERELRQLMIEEKKLELQQKRMELARGFLDLQKNAADAVRKYGESNIVTFHIGEDGQVQFRLGQAQWSPGANRIMPAKDSPPEKKAGKKRAEREGSEETTE